MTRRVLVIMGICFGLGACQPKPKTIINAREVTRPEGGDILALAHNQKGMMALSATTLYQLNDQRAWSAYRPTPSDELNTITPWIASRHQVAMMGAEERFVAHDDTLWLLTQNAQTPILMHKAAKEDLWRAAALPHTRVIKTGQNIAPTLVSNPRLLAYEALYLIEAQGLWRVTLKPNQSGVSFEAVSLEGLSLNDAATSRRQLPYTLRHFIPAQGQRTYDVLSILSDQLRIYTRHQGTKKWVMTSSLPVLDHALKPSATGDHLWLVGERALYRGEELAERWQRVPIAGLQANETITAMESVVEDDQEHLLIGTSTGTLYLSVDDGKTWTKTRPSDGAQRAIRDIHQDPQYKTIWVATAGQGVLRSKDGGNQWASLNNGLHATHPQVMQVGLNGALLLGTDAGLFSLTKLQPPTAWQRLHAEPTTALAITRATQTTISGTTSGQVILMNTDGQPRAYSPDYSALGEAAPFEPGLAWQRRSPPQAVLAFVQDDQKTLMMTHHKGLLSFAQDLTFYHQTPKQKQVLKQALQGASITSLIRHDGALLMTTQGSDIQEAVQVWRSKDDGTTWHARFGLKQAQPELLTRLILKNKTPHLIHQGRIYQLKPKSNRLDAVEHPWDRDHILLDLDTTHPDYDLALLKTNRGMNLQQMTKSGELMETFHIRAENQSMLRGLAWSIQSDQNVVFLKNNVSVLYLDWKNNEDNQDQSIAIIISTFAIMLMATTGFALLKLYG